MAINYKNEVKKIVEWIKKYMDDSVCQGYVVGVSGGLDSAVVTALCCSAVGKNNVIAVYLPCESSPVMEEDAIQLTNNLHIDLRIFNLIDSYNSIIKRLEEKGETVSQLTKANTKARLRMTMLFAIGNQYNYLVAGTGNKSELDIGYCTFGGDSVVSCEPLGNYYKTEVYKIAETIPQIPKNILTKKPSADLFEGQTDEQEIGFTYNKLDKILQALEAGDIKELYKHSIDDIEKIQNMIKISKYKNNAPLRYIRD